MPRPILAFALSLILAGCGASTDAAGPAADGDTDYADAMAAEHADETPAATAATAPAPSAEVSGEAVTYATLDGKAIAGYLARPTAGAAGGKAPGVLMIHEWWGLNDNIRAMARRMAGEGYVTLAVDLYEGEVASDPGRARELIGTVDPARAVENLRQARAYLTGAGGAADSVGVIGWCFGGGWALRTGLALGEEIDAVVMYYGQPITDPEELAELQAPLLGIFGGQDSGIPLEAVNAMSNALGKLHKPVEIVVYPQAGHAFANPSGERYRPEDAESAWERTIDELRHSLSPGPEAQ